MKKICIIYTGGTIGMVPTERGYAPRKGYFSQALAEIDELQKPEVPDWEMVEFDPLLDSSNVAVNEWNRIGRTIRDRYDDYDGFVVLHGTDTMAYSASALSFMLDGLDKPVIFTGSQIPLCMLRSDARDNILTSLMIAGEGKVREVCLYFAGKLLRGNRSTKSSADRFVAFDSPNCAPLANVGIDITYEEGAIRHFRSDRKLRGPLGMFGGRLRLSEFQNTPIGVIKVFPGIQFRLFEQVMTDSLSGIVLETFGAGNIPEADGALLPMIRKAYENGTVIVVCSQCPQGTVHLGAYEASAALVGAGAVSGYDMTTEAAIAKLYYLFSQGLSRDDIKRYMEIDLRGELTK